eukprot:TRINITY_DN14366_c0_g1_i1.p1 TRINITY_DN14366_c0_g1~~TRINITY_DN14366_c0_g1_i1.p1  ORF type:complete len:130 (+),score=5.01 TRINITY_DN14366_c0_g1_i1:128-517(+)
MNAIQLLVKSSEFTELAGAGNQGSIVHQGGTAGVSASAIIVIESSTKPEFDTSDPTRFRDNPVTFYLHDTDYHEYRAEHTLWAISQNGDQLLSIDPPVTTGGGGGGGSSETPASIKARYESNANTNAFN